MERPRYAAGSGVPTSDRSNSNVLEASDMGYIMPNNGSLSLIKLGYPLLLNIVN